MTKKRTSLLKREVKVSEWLQTGSTLLDCSISCNKNLYGGIPTRRIIEFSGTGASGKTYTCGEICGDALRKGYEVHVDDIERRWDLTRSETFGFTSDNKNFKYLDGSSSVEGCFEVMFRTLDKVKSGMKLLYVVDPIAALYAEQEKKSDKMSQARAKALQKHMRFLKDRVTGDKTSSVCVIFSNQLIDAVGQKFGPQKISPGGNAMIHWPSVRVKFSAPGKVIDKFMGRKEEIKRVIGVKLRGEVIKNSEDDAFRDAEFRVIYGYGIDDIHDCAIWLKEHTDVLGESDGWFQIPKSRKRKLVPKNIQGIKNFVKYVEEHNLEKRLAALTRKYYRKWYEPMNRKPKQR
jgi:recombination protein RecA